jgi:hypothetical protein
MMIQGSLSAQLTAIVRRNMVTTCSETPRHAAPFTDNSRTPGSKINLKQAYEKAIRRSIMNAIPAICLVIALCFAPLFAHNASAAESLITGKISAVVVAKDKNGAEYVRVLVPETKKLNGISYQVNTAIFVFGPEMVAQAKSLKPGDAKKFVVQKTVKDGREFTHALALQ